MKIQMKNYDTEVVVEIPEEATISQVMDAIMGMLTTLTYTDIPNSIRDYLDDNYPEDCKCGIPKTGGYNCMRTDCNMSK